MNKKNRNNKLVLFLIILILGISIGYSVLSANLRINGVSNVKKINWNVHWENAKVKEGSVTTIAPTFSEENTVATYSVTLTNPGDYYEFTLDEKNDGTIDAIVNLVESKIDGTIINNNIPNYLEYSVTYEDGSAINVGDELNSGQKKTIKVVLKYSENITASDLSDEDITHEFSLSIKYVQKKKNNTIVKAFEVVEGDSSDIQPGDLVKIGNSENFYVVSSDSTKTVLFAKYNLLVGVIEDNFTIVGHYDENTPGYNLQNREASAYTRSATGSYRGGVKFYEVDSREPAYWANSNYTLKSPYGEEGSYFPDEMPFPYVYDNNSLIYPYVETYVEKLKEMGAPSSTKGRLLSYEELDSLKNVIKDEKSIVFDGEQSYWLGSARNTTDLWYSHSTRKETTNLACNNETDAGVRVVIEIPTSAIK